MTDESAPETHVGRPARVAPGLTRRGLLKAGAWAAPVIVLATATPAAAASMPVEGAVTVSSASARLVGTQENFGGIEGTLTLVSGATPPAAGGIVVTMQVIATGLLVQAPGVDTGSGWQAVSGEHDPDVGSYTFTFLWPTDLPNGASTSELAFSLPGDGGPQTEPPTVIFVLVEVPNAFGDSTFIEIAPFP